MVLTSPTLLRCWRPSGMLLVVGGCWAGMPPEANGTTDLLATVTDAEDDLQLFWEVGAPVWLLLDASPMLRHVAAWHPWLQKRGRAVSSASHAATHACFTNDVSLGCGR